MFSQIDFNDDQTIDWDELTSFTIQTGLVATSQSDLGTADDVIIEYLQDNDFATQRSTSHQMLTSLRYHRGTKRVMVIDEDQFAIRTFDVDGQLLGTIIPDEVIGANKATVNERSAHKYQPLRSNTKTSQQKI